MVEGFLALVATPRYPGGETMVDDEEKETDLPKQIAFHYVKSSQFRVVHGDGIIGGITPQGLLHFAVYSERPAIPQVVVHDVDAEGRIGKESQKVGREGVVRELEVDVIIGISMAKAIRDWLTDKLGEAEKLKLTRKDPE
jgi:hypothetical protein